MSKIVVSFDCFGEFWLPAGLLVSDLKIALAKASHLTGITELFVGSQRLDSHHVVGLFPLVAGCHLSLTAALPGSTADPIVSAESCSPCRLAGLHNGTLLPVQFKGKLGHYHCHLAPGITLSNRFGRNYVRAAPGWVLANHRLARLRPARRIRVGTPVTVVRRDTGEVGVFQLRGPNLQVPSLLDRLRAIPASRWIPATISAAVATVFAVLLNRPLFLLLGLSMPLMVLGTALFGQDRSTPDLGRDLSPDISTPDVLTAHDGTATLPDSIARLAGSHPLDPPQTPTPGYGGPLALIGPQSLLEPFARALVLGRSRFDLAAAAPVAGLSVFHAEDWMRWLPGGAHGTEHLLLLASRNRVPSWCRFTAVVTQSGITWYDGTVELGTTLYYGLTPARAEHLARKLMAADASASTSVSHAPGGAGDADTASASLPERVVLPDTSPNAAGSPGSGPELRLSSHFMTKPLGPGIDVGHGNLPVPLGIGTAGVPIDFDLVAHGPHALVAGTTGAGKSELLQTLVLGLAARYSPSQVAIALVDYKGGSGFSHCKDLPHVVGMVTDLDPGSARRAIAGLSIQLKERERLFLQHSVTSFTDFHAATDGRVILPRIVIVVDELRAMIDDEPDFVPNLVRIAAQGRSLGMHLVLATQRPSGAITGEMRANLNARLCLRVATGQDSLEVLDSTAAAQIPARLAGRAFLKVGGDSPKALQTYYAADSPQAAQVVKSARDGQTGALYLPKVATPATSPLLARVTAVTTRWAHVLAPEPLWAPPLPTLVQLTARVQLTTPATPDADPTSDGTIPLGAIPQGAIPLGLGEVAGRQTATTVAMRLGSNLAILGPSRAGHSTAIRTLVHGAVAAGLHVHGIGLTFSGPATELTPQQFGDLPGLGTFALPHEFQRITALFQTLLTNPGPAQTLLLIDGLTQLRTTLEGHHQGRGWELLLDLFRAAAHLHLTIVVSSTSGLPNVLTPLVGQRLVFLTDSSHDDQFLGVPPPWAGTGRISGRAVLLGDSVPTLVQVAQDVLGWDGPQPFATNIAPAIRIPALPTASRQPSTELGQTLAPGAGITGAAMLEPVAVPLTGNWIIAGTPGSGRSTTASRFARAHHEQGSLLGAFAAARAQPSRKVSTENPWWHPMEMLPELTQELARHGPLPSGTVILDDVDDMMQRNPQVTQQAVDSIIAAGHHVVATLRTANLTQVKALPVQLLGTSNGITLAPNQRQHLVFLGHPVEEFTDPGHLNPSGTVPGRGVMVWGGRALPIQIASATG